MGEKAKQRSQPLTRRRQPTRWPPSRETSPPSVRRRAHGRATTDVRTCLREERPDDLHRITDERHDRRPPGRRPRDRYRHTSGRRRGRGAAGDAEQPRRPRQQDVNEPRSGPFAGAGERRPVNHPRTSRSADGRAAERGGERRRSRRVDRSRERYGRTDDPGRVRGRRGGRLDRPRHEDGRTSDSGWAGRRQGKGLGHSRNRDRRTSDPGGAGRRRGSSDAREESPSRRKTCAAT